MTDLNDGFDEILPYRPFQPDTLPPMDAATEYKHDMHHIRSRYRYDTIDVYASPEFRLLRNRLIRIVGKMAADDIMDQNL